MASQIRVSCGVRGSYNQTHFRRVGLYSRQHRRVDGKRISGFPGSSLLFKGNRKLIAHSFFDNFFQKKEPPASTEKTPPPPQPDLIAYRNDALDQESSTTTEATSTVIEETIQDAPIPVQEQKQEEELTSNIDATSIPEAQEVTSAVEDGFSGVASTEQPDVTPMQQIDQPDVTSPVADSSQVEATADVASMQQIDQPDVTAPVADSSQVESTADVTSPVESVADSSQVEATADVTSTVESVADSSQVEATADVTGDSTASEQVDTVASVPEAEQEVAVDSDSSTDQSLGSGISDDGAGAVSGATAVTSEVDTAAVTSESSASTEKKTQEKKKKSDNRNREPVVLSENAREHTRRMQRSLYKKNTSQEIFEYLKAKYESSTPELDYDIAGVMEYVEQMVSPFARERNQRRTFKLKVLFELLLADLKDRVQFLTLSEKVKCMKCLGEGNLLVRAYPYTEPEETYFNMFDEILQQKDEFSAEDVILLSASIPSFRKIPPRDNMSALHQILKARFQTSPPDVKAKLLHSANQIRFYDDEFSQIVQQDILADKVATETYIDTRSIIQFFSAFNIQNEQVLDHCVEKFIGAEKKEPQGIAMTIWNLEILNFPAEKIQNIIDQTYGRMNDEELKSYGSNDQLMHLRLAQLLYKDANIQYPKVLADLLHEKENQVSRKQYTNYAIKEISQFLGKKFPEAKIEGQKMLAHNIVYADLGVSWNGKQVAIQVRFPLQFMTSDPTKLMRQAKASFEIVENFGWKVVVVNSEKFFEKQSNDYKEVIAGQIEEIFKSEEEVESAWKLM